MRKRVTIPIVCVLGVLGFYVWKMQRAPRQEALGGQAQSNLEEQAARRQQSQQLKEASAVSQASSNPIETSVNQITRLSKAEQMAEARMRANAPIQFYGKVVDQDGNPVPGAKVHAHYREYVRIALMAAAENNHEIDLTTDANGRCEFSGVKGETLYVDSVGKAGYELSSRAPLTSPFGSVDRDSPPIFRLWKRQGADRLVMGDKLYGIVPDGRIYTLDLLTHKKLEGDQATGDLKVTIRRPEKIARKTNFDWTFTIDGAGGGVIESDDEFKNLAPETGYQPHYEFNMPASSPAWVPQVRKDFYFRSREGKIYGRMTVEVIPDYRDKSAFSVKYAVNPTGSRNLEYDYRQSTSTENYFPPE